MRPFPISDGFWSLCLNLPRSVRGSWPPWCVRSAHRDTLEEDAQRPHQHCWSVRPPRPLHGAPSRRWSTRSPAFPRHTHKCRPVAVVGGPPPHLQWVLKDEQAHDPNIILTLYKGGCYVGMCWVDYGNFSGRRAESTWILKVWIVWRRRKKKITFLQYRDV